MGLGSTTGSGSMKRFFGLAAVLLALSFLTACGGVPLRSVPRLMQLQSQLLEANPAEFMVALQMDARLVPPPGAVPLLVIKVTPREPAAFAAIDKKLALQLSVASGATQGLEPPPAGRRWLIYSMPAATQAELRQIQDTIKRAKAAAQGSAAGSLSLGVEQDSMAAAVTDPTLANTRWDTWLQTQKSDGFFEAWSGTTAQLKKSF
jgi:hypothetical protein